MNRRQLLPKIEGKSRVEGFSDGVMAIIVTLLIFEMRVPSIGDGSTGAVLAGLWSIAPKFVSFAISFATVAIYWVNHHHFFHLITHTDWKLLWFNNIFLFWLTVVPFTTAFIGDYPTQPVVVALYALVLAFAGASFTALGYYVYFVGNLVSQDTFMEERRRDFKRAVAGTLTYVFCAVISFVYVYAALAIMAIVPLTYVVPNLLRRDQEAG